jgi:hypothetical protein
MDKVRESFDKIKDKVEIVWPLEDELRPDRIRYP